MSVSGNPRLVISYKGRGPARLQTHKSAPTICYPSSHFPRIALLCPQQFVMKKFFLMRILPSSLRSRLFRNRLLPLSHGRKSGFCLFSSSQNHLHPRSSIPSHQRFVAFCRLFLFLLIYPLQFVRNVGITHGDESRVGYYVGMMVCPRVDSSTTSHIALSSNLCFSLLKLLQCYTGAGSPMSSVVNPLSSLGCSAYRCQCSALGSQLLIGAPLFGTYPFLKISHLIDISYRI